MAGRSEKTARETMLIDIRGKAHLRRPIKLTEREREVTNRYFVQGLIKGCIVAWCFGASLYPYFLCTRPKMDKRIHFHVAASVSAVCVISFTSYAWRKGYQELKLLGEDSPVSEVIRHNEAWAKRGKKPIDPTEGLDLDS